MRVAGVPFIQAKNRYGTSTKFAVAIHCTANTASARNEASYATRRTDGVSAHFFVDDREVIQSLDTVDIAGHAGSWQGNTYSIAVEITGHVHWSRDKWLKSVAWGELARVLAAVSRHHNIPPVRVTVEQMRANPQVRGAYDHNQMRLAWGGTDHTDPGPDFPWDHLLNVWKRAYEGDEMPSPKDFVEALLKADLIPNDINPGEKGKPGYNPEMTVLWALRYGTHATLAHRGVQAAREEIKALSAKVDAQAKKIEELIAKIADMQAPGIDYAKLAVALLSHIPRPEADS